MRTGSDLSRRDLLATAAGAAMVSAFPSLVWAQGAPIMTRPIPSSGELLPVVGIGTSIVFDFDNDPAKYAERRQVLQDLVAGGGKLIDTASTYGYAEERVGDLSADLGDRDKLFVATKYESRADKEAANASMQNSLKRLRTDRIDLMQAHNVGDPNFSLAQLRDWKAQGLCRYVGVTSSFERQYDALAQVLRREKPDFFQINYSVGDRGAEDVLLPTAKDAGCAVLTNLPFGRNSLFKAVAGKSAPDWAKDIDATSWAQIFLKFNLSNPAVTAVIPGTDKPEYMLDNLGAGRGRLPDAAMRQKIIAAIG
jgi:aryl-alcohol dehydrogenase-like predicted oxidoreductase